MEPRLGRIVGSHLLNASGSDIIRRLAERLCDGAEIGKVVSGKGFIGDGEDGDIFLMAVLALAMALVVSTDGASTVPLLNHLDKVTNTLIGSASIAGPPSRV